MTEHNKTSKLAQKTIRGTVWVYISKYSAKLLVFISTAILARLLTKEDFGLAGYALLALTFIDFIEGLGIRQALIYYDEDDERTNTGFWLGLLVGGILFIAAWFIVAPAAGWFFKDPQAVPITRALAFSMPLSALTLVHQALLEKKMDFKRQVFPDLANSIGKGAISISFAFLGFGAWSLIYGQLAGGIATVLAFWAVIRWRPAFRLSREYIRPLMTYGTQIIYNDALGTLLANLDYLLIGRLLGSAALGVYTLAFRIPELLIKQFSGILGKVIFPAYAAMRHTENGLKNGFLLTLQYVNMMTVPMGLGLALIAKPTILVFFGEKWLEGTQALIAISIYSLLRAMVFNVGDVYKALGRPDILVKIHIGQAVVSLPALWYSAAVLGTITAVAWTQVVLILIANIAKLIISKKIIECSYREIVQALRPSLVSGLVMSVVVFGVLQGISSTTPALQLITGGVLGVVIYAGTLLLLERALVIDGINTLGTALRLKKSK